MECPLSPYNLNKNLAASVFEKQATEFCQNFIKKYNHFQAEETDTNLELKQD